jgi:hypothetical protein
MCIFYNKLDLFKATCTIIQQTFFFIQTQVVYHFFQPFLRINKSQDVRNFCLPQLPDPQDPQGDPGLPGVNAIKLFAHEAPLRVASWPCPLV